MTKINLKIIGSFNRKTSDMSGQFSLQRDGGLPQDSTVKSYGRGADVEAHILTARTAVDHLKASLALWGVEPKDCQVQLIVRERSMLERLMLQHTYRMSRPGEARLAMMAAELVRDLKAMGGYTVNFIPHYSR